MFPIFKLKGTPFEIGYQHGSQAKELVERSVTNYQMMFIAHTNHFLSERLLGKVHDIGREMGIDSFLRLDRVGRLFAAAPKIDLETLKQIQGDHYNYPTGICRHLHESDPMLIASIFSVVLDLTNKEMHLAPGQPCEHDYTTLKLT